MLQFKKWKKMMDLFHPLKELSDTSIKFWIEISHFLQKYATLIHKWMVFVIQFWIGIKLLSL